MRNFCFLFICLIACTSGQKGSKDQVSGTSQPTVVKEEEKISEKDPAVSGIDTSDVKQLIVPGKRIGKINLNEDAEFVHKLLGIPTSANAAMGRSLQTWVTKTSDSTSRTITIFFSRNMGNADEKSRVKQIRITSAAFMTKQYEQATTLTFRNNIQEAKQTATYTLPGSTEVFSIHDNIKNGIAFEFDQPGNVIAITVHEPNKAAFEVFTEVSPDLKKNKPSEQTTIKIPGIMY